MRLYNSTSCTPVGGTTTSSPRKVKWSPPNAFVPKGPSTRPSSEPRNPVSTTGGFYSGYSFFDTRNDGRGRYPEDESGSSRMSNSTLSTQSTQALTPIQRNRSFALPRKTTPANSGSFYSPRKVTQGLGRQSWSPRAGSFPFMVMPSNAMCNTASSSPPNIKLKPRTRHSHYGKKENFAPEFDEQFSASLASMSLITEPQGNDAFASPKQSSSQSSDDSVWLDFSLDGSNNPFQVHSKKKSKSSPESQAHFSPIEKQMSQGRRTPVMTVKPAPVQRTKSAHVLFPSQHSRQPTTSFMTVANEPSAFAAPVRKSSMIPSLAKPVDKKRGRQALSRTRSAAARPSSAPLLAPSRNDVEPIIFSHASSDKSEVSPSKSLIDFSKYTNMLRTAVPFDYVQLAMERDGVDGAIIGLVVAAHNSP